MSEFAPSDWDVDFSGEGHGHEGPIAIHRQPYDELSGFVTACALVRPGKAIAGLETSSVKKKLKDKAFARTVNRDDVYRGAIELAVDLDEHIGFVVQALTAVAPRLGLG